MIDESSESGGDILAQIILLTQDPPIDPRAAAFEDIVHFLLDLLTRETRPYRRERVDAQAKLYIQTRLGEAQRANTREEQRGGLSSAVLRDPRRMDARKARQSHLPASLVSEYEDLLPALKRILGRDRKWQQKRIRAQLTERFPELASSPAALEAAADEPPSGAAYVILGQRYRVSADRIRKEVWRQRSLVRAIRRLSGGANLPR